MAKGSGRGLVLLASLGFVGWLLAPGKQPAKTPLPPAAAHLPAAALTPAPLPAPPVPLHAETTTPPAPRPEPSFVYATARVNVRSGAAANAHVAARVDRGAKLQIVSLSGDWQRVRYGANEGWVHRNYLAPEPPPDPPSPCENQQRRTGQLPPWLFRASRLLLPRAPSNQRVPADGRLGVPL